MSAWLGIGRDEVELLHRFQVAMTDRPGCYVLGALVERLSEDCAAKQS